MYPTIEIKKNEINTKKDIDCAIPKKKNNERSRSLFHFIFSHFVDFYSSIGII